VSKRTLVVFSVVVLAQLSTRLVLAGWSLVAVKSSGPPDWPTDRPTDACFPPRAASVRPRRRAALRS